MGQPAFRRLALAAVLLAGLASPAAPGVTSSALGREGAGDAETSRYIVVLHGDADVTERVAGWQRRLGLRPTHEYRSAFRGFAARLTPRQRDSLLTDPAVRYIVPDRVVRVQGQVEPSGVTRVRAPDSEVAGIDGVDGAGERVDVDVAIVDTGIQRDHPDLHVVGGYNCTTSNRAAFDDAYGHGTHVAGTAAALDNGIGVVGVAPGARLWAVRVFDEDGIGYLSWYACGVDWITSQRDPVDPGRPLFEVANMSLRTKGSDDGNCGRSNEDPLHEAICRAVAGGTTVVVAAGNDRVSASNWVPAGYGEVITVSALADFDGLPGGKAASTCDSWGSWDRDDTFADFSNFGSDVDLIAPGKCIYSTKIGSSYGLMSGTSMAAPTVAGGAALYLAAHPGATPANVRAALRGAGSPRWQRESDPDGTHERLLDVASFGRGEDFGLVALREDGLVGSGGGQATFTVELVRHDGFSGTIALSASRLPAGASASFSPAAAERLSSISASLTLTLPAGLASGSYPFTITGTSNGRSRSTTAAVTVDADAPVAGPPRTHLARSGLSAHGIPVSVSWTKPTDVGSGVARLELQVSTDGRTFVAAGTFAAERRSVVRWLSPAHAYRFRLRALDAAGNQSPWAEGAPFRLSLVESSSRSVAFRGEWRTERTSTASDGSLRYTTQAAATGRIRVTAREIAWVSTLAPDRGRAHVNVNGGFAATVNTRAETTVHRRFAWVGRWARGAERTIDIRAEGTPGRPRVDLDAFVVLR